GPSPRRSHDCSLQSDKLLLRQTRFANQRPQLPSGQLPMVWHRQLAHLRMAQDDVAARFDGPPGSQAFQKRGSRPARNRPAGGSYGYLDDLLADGRWHRLAVFLETGQVASDGILDIGQRFGARLSLRNAAGKRGAFRYEYSVLVRLNHHSIFHAGNLRGPLWKVNRRNHALSLLSPEPEEMNRLASLRSRSYS